jgi:tetratricopeptide (TPR) repeat protein
MRNASGSAAQIVEEARSSIKLEDYVKASELLQQAIALDPKYETAWEELSAVTMWQGDSAHAEKLFAQAREVPIISNKFWYTLAQSLHGATAQECYRLALSSNPDDEQSLLELAWSLRSDGDKENASKLYRYLMHVYCERGDWRGLNSLGDTLRRLVRNYDDAEDALRKSLEIKADNFEAWKNLCYLMCGRADLSGAQQTMRRFIQQYPQHPQKAEAWVCLSNVLKSFGDLTGAEEAVRQALVVDENCQSAWSKLADIRFEQNDFAEGEKALQRANDLDYNKLYDRE